MAVAAVQSVTRQRPRYGRLLRPPRERGGRHWACAPRRRCPNGTSASSATPIPLSTTAIWRRAGTASTWPTVPTPTMTITASRIRMCWRTGWRTSTRRPRPPLGRCVTVAETQFVESACRTARCTLCRAVAGTQARSRAIALEARPRRHRLVLVDDWGHRGTGLKACSQPGSWYGSPLVTVAARTAEDALPRRGCAKADLKAWRPVSPRGFLACCMTTTWGRIAAQRPPSRGGVEPGGPRPPGRLSSGPLRYPTGVCSVRPAAVPVRRHRQPPAAP